MKQILTLGAILAVLTLMLVPAAALTGTNGYEATLLFTLSDVDADLPAWTDLVVGFGDATPSYPGDAVAVDSAGRVYAQVYGYVSASDATWYTGVVRSDADGTNLTGILQEEWTEYGQIRNVAVAPVTNGHLTQDDLVIVRDGYDAEDGGYMEIVVVDPDAPSTQTQVHAWAPGGYYGGGYVHLTIDPSTGDLFFLQYLNSTSGRDGSIRKLHWNGTSYDESTVTSADTAMLDLVVGSDGSLYSFEAGDGDSSRDTILQIDPDGSDTWTDYATLAVNLQPDSYYGWAWDTSGTFWIAEFGLKRGKRQGRVTEVKEGRTVSARDRIANCGTALIYGMTAGPDGKLYVVEENDAVYELAPGASSGGGGKGKKK